MECECGNELEGYDMYCKECQKKYQKSINQFTEQYNKNNKKEV